MSQRGIASWNSMMMDYVESKKCKEVNKKKLKEDQENKLKENLSNKWSTEIEKQ